MILHHQPLLPGAIILAVLAGTCAAAAEDYRVYVVRPAINNDPILADEALPVQCRDETHLRVMCARGEYEPCSFLVQTDRLLNQVMVTVSPLQGDAGTLAAGAVDVRIAQKFYMPVTWTCETLPWVLVHDPGMIKIINHTPKYYRELEDETVGPPDARHPVEEYRSGHSKINSLAKELIDTPTLQPADIADFRQFWLTVHVPEDASSGTYRGQVTITAANASPTTLSLEVVVPSFDLLPPPFEYSAYYPTMLDRPDFAAAQRDRYHPITEQQHLAECRNMVAHGLTNPNIYVGPERNETGGIHFTQLSRVLELREQAGHAQGCDALSVRRRRHGHQGG